MITVYYSHYVPVSDSIPEVSAQEHALGRALLLHGLRELYGLCLAPEQLDSRLAAGTCGKPYLADRPGIQFNITHCDGLAACAFGDRPVGIDAELPGYFAEVLISRALSAGERELLAAAAARGESLRREWFFRLWTLKEAYVKMTGTGVDVPLREISFSFLPEAQQVNPSFPPKARQGVPSSLPSDARHDIPSSFLPETRQVSPSFPPKAQQGVPSSLPSEVRKDILSSFPPETWKDVIQSPESYTIRCSKPHTSCFQQVLRTGHLLALCFEDRDGERPAVRFVSVPKDLPAAPGS